MPRPQPRDTASPHSPKTPSADARAELDNAEFDRRFGPLRPPTPAVAVLTVHDHVGLVSDALRAYEALEMLITPAYAADSERLDLDRSQLGCLLRTVNRVMRQELGTLDQVTRDARAVVGNVH